MRKLGHPPGGLLSQHSVTNIRMGGENLLFEYKGL